MEINAIKYSIVEQQVSKQEGPAFELVSPGEGPAVKFISQGDGPAFLSYNNWLLLR